MKVALVYDRVNKWGGAERVLLTLHEMFREAPLYTSVYDPKSAPWASVFPKIYTSFLQNLPFSIHHELYATLMPLAFESFNFDPYDLVISLTSEAAKGIITKPKTKHICYCLTPTRYLWSGYEDYFKNKWLRVLSKPVVSYLRAWDKIAAQRPDKLIAISKEVRRRIKKYYGIESVMVYPPITLSSTEVVGTKFFSSAIARSTVARREDGLEQGADIKRFVPPRANSYFLVVSRLVPYKRVDIVVDAFNELGWPLKVVGTGSELERLKRKARKNIKFLENLTDSELVSYYENCRALVSAGVEDFGLSLVEAQLAGRPVITAKLGGALESIRQGRTGEFLEAQTKKALIKVLKDFNDKDYSQEDCQKQAAKFSKQVFERRLRKALEKYL